MDSRTVQAIQRLAKTRAEPEPLAPIAPPVQILASSSIGRNPPASSGAGGIEGPLTEIDRTYYTAKAVSSDGLFTWAVPHVISMRDAAGRPVDLIMLEP
jgi:hypothetical protein